MKCEYCNIGIITKYGSGRFCNAKCARGYSTSKNREETSQKISQALQKPPRQFTCIGCSSLVIGGRKNTLYCSRQCTHQNPVLQAQRSLALSITLKKRFAEDLPARNRLREIGRKGGFGTRCETLAGVKCDSIFERKCFEILDTFSISYKAHKALPNSSRISDAYIPSTDTWLEFDGINREKRYKDKTSSRWLQWEGKLNEYRDKKLRLMVFTSHQQVVDFCKN